MRQSALFGLCVLSTLGGAHASELVVHEWGTITSVHQATGSPVSGLNKIDAADVLPDFVHRFEPEATRQDPKRRVGKSPFVPGRPDVTMRLETPVIYFYPPLGASTPPLDVTVNFRGGVLNEFYPDAAASVSLDGRRIDDKLRAGMFSAWDGHRLNDFVLGTLEWKGLQLSDAIAPPATTSAVWLAPRNVRATGVITPQGESEHYVFYRGVAHLDALFQTQYTTSGLRLTTPARPLWAGQPRLEVPFVWLVQVRRDGLIAFHELGPRTLGTERFNVEVARVGRFPMEAFAESGARRLRDSMKNRLEHAGLFTPEAEAMLNTWKASYYEKPGVRVFYIVPRAWTDHFLPLKISVPAEITRVFVGRIDIAG
jgi:hypothetical protein